MTVKNILTIFLSLACLGAWAQTPPANDGSEAAKAEALRQAMRAALASGNAGNTNANAAVTTLAANTVPGQATPGLPANNNIPALPTNRPPVRPGFNPAAFANGNNNPPGVHAPGPRANQQPPGFKANPTVPPPPMNMPAPALPAVAPVPAKQPEPMIPAGTMDFKEMPLPEVLEIYAQLVGRTVIHGPLPQITLTLRTQGELTRSEGIQALDSMLAMNNITMIPVGEKFIKVATQPQQVFAAAKPFSTRKAADLPEADEYISDIVQLNYAKPTELVQTLLPFAQIPNGILPVDSSQTLVIRDYAGNVKRMLELINKIDVTVPLDYDSEVIPIKYAKASDIASALGSLGGGTGTSIGHSSNTGTGRTGTMGSGMMGSGMGTGTMGSGMMGQPGSTMGSPMGGSNPRTSSFTDRLNSIVKKAAQQGDFNVLGQTKIIADERTNSLLVFAGKQDMDMIKKIVGELDVVLAQVLIESIIMEVSLDNSHALGFNYVQNQPTTAGHGYFTGLGGLNNGTFLSPNNFASAGTNLASSIPGGFSYWANFGNDFQATMTAIAADSRINVLSKPRIQTSHGVPATIQVGNQVPMVTGTYFGGISGVGSSSQYQMQFVGIQLQVTPLINPDGLVVMDIQQDVQQLGNNYTIDGNQVPSTTQRSAQATVSVKDRDTIILGGMISSTKSTSHSGVPILKDIPVLGNLFRSSNVDKQRVELIVLIHPTVLPTPEAAALVATHERNRLPGVKAAEADERRDEIQRMKESDKIKVPDDKY